MILLDPARLHRLLEGAKHPEGTQMKQRNFLSISLFALLASPSLADEVKSPLPPPIVKKQPAPFRLRFANTDVSDVLQALSLKTKASIVFPSQMKKPISVEFTASTTEEALRFVTAAAGLSYHLMGRTYVVAAPSEIRQALEPFGERATLSLSTIPADDAVKMLQNALPFLTARPIGKQVLVIGGMEDIAQARTLLDGQDKPRIDVTMQTGVIVLQKANATQVAALIKVMYDGVKAEAVGQADKPGGSIGISGTKEQVANATMTARMLDEKGPNAEPDRAYRVYHIRHSSALLLQDFLTKAAPNVQTLVGPEHYAPPAPGFHPLSSTSFGSSSGGGSSPGGSASGGSGAPAGGGASAGTPDASAAKTGDRSKMLVLSGLPLDLDNAFKLLEQLDVAPQQVLVEVKVVDTSPENAEQIGAQYTFNPLNFFEVPKNTGVATIGSNTQGVGVGQFSRIPFSFNAQISAMVSRKEAKILANPRVMVVDNEDANIFIGDTVRTKISQASTNGTTIQVLEFPIGIVLLVRPRVNADGRITMRVHPVVSTITAIGADNLPQTSSREAETTVMIKDGETIVLGGLIRDEMLRTVQEVPILSKLPIVGELFKYRSKDHRHSEIMVFITPHILNEDAQVTQNAVAKIPGKDNVK